MMTASDNAQMEKAHRTEHDLRFWLILMAICLTLFLSALELAAVATALPTIVSDLHGRDFVWVGAGYVLSSSAVLPMTGGLAQIFGRRPCILGSIGFFAIGSIICGAAKNLRTLIVGRVIQGVGGGGIISLSNIVLADMVSLAERGLYAGLFGLTWSLAGAIGPVVGGSLSTIGQWRLLFYLNLPLCSISAFVIIILLDVPTPPGTLRTKLAQMDWFGNLLIIASSFAVTFALARGGINAPWQSAAILTPLITGVIGLFIFIVYEALLSKYPLVPYSILSNRTSVSGYIQTFLLPVTTIATIYYIPVYWQACKDANAVRSGILGLGLSSIAPGAVVGGVSVRILKRYRPQLWTGWCLTIIGAGLLTTVKRDTSPGITVGYCVIYGVGAGIIYGAQVYPVLAPLPVTANAHASAFFSFMRTFSGVWGVTLGGAILQNQLIRHLPAGFVEKFPGGVAIAYSAIPVIKDLPQPLKDDVRLAFAESLVLIWKVLVGVSVLGLLSSLCMEGLPLQVVTDQEWALVPTADAEKI